MPLWMRNRTNQVTSSCDNLPRLNMHLAGNRQVELRESRQAKVGTTLSLADALTQPDKRLWRQSKGVPVKLENNAVALIRLDPQGIRGTFRPYTLDPGMQIHDATLDRTPCRIGTHCVDANSDPVGLPLDDTAIGCLYFYDFTIDRAHDTQRRGWDETPRIAKEQDQNDQPSKRDQGKPRIEIAQHIQEQSGHHSNEWQAFRCNKWITLASQVLALPMQREATIPWITPRVNTEAVFPTKKGING